MRVSTLGLGWASTRGYIFLANHNMYNVGVFKDDTLSSPRVGIYPLLEIRPQLIAAGYIEIEFVSSPVLVLNTKKNIERWQKLFSIQVKTLIVLLT